MGTRGQHKKRPVVLLAEDVDRNKAVGRVDEGEMGRPPRGGRG